MNKIHRNKNTSTPPLPNFECVYQYANGEYLPDSSQPNADQNYEITTRRYTPHEGTRYVNISIGSNGKAQRIDKNESLIDANRELPELYTKREDCCGCTACYAICPVSAILMRPDEEGFLYPVVAADKCLRCYKCLKVCPVKSKE